MSKTLDTLLASRYWVAHIDDERSQGNIPDEVIIANTKVSAVFSIKTTSR